MSLSAYCQVNFGVRGGMNLSTVYQNMKDSRDEVKTLLRPGFQLGLVVETKRGRVVGMETGLLYSRKGYAVNLEREYLEGIDVKGYKRYTFSYLQVPLHYTFILSRSIHCYAGPYLAMAVGGSLKQDYEARFEDLYAHTDEDFSLRPVYGAIDSEDMEDDEFPVRAMDYGLDFGVGFGKGRTCVEVAYSLGLGNMIPEYNDKMAHPEDGTVCNRVFSLTLRWMMNK